VKKGNYEEREKTEFMKGQEQMKKERINEMTDGRRRTTEERTAKRRTD
jgi:hypothetical protein